MKRRELIVLLGGAVAAWPVAVRAQQKAMPVLGILTTSSSTLPPEEAAFLDSLRELGYLAGNNLAITRLGSDNRPELLPSLAAELVKRKVDVILCTGSEEAVAAKQATASIPIVMLSKDPVGIGLVASHAHPGGNITGLDLLGGPLSGKRVELLKELIPRIGRIAAVWNPDDPTAAEPLEITVAAAHALGMQVQRLEARDATALDGAFDAAARGGAEAILVVATTLVGAQVVRIAELALRQRMPVIFYADTFPRAGGLMSYGPNFPAIYRRLASYVDRILKGAKPAELPVELPTKFDMVINLKTAKALGLTIPQSILARADEVIE